MVDDRQAPLDPGISHPLLGYLNFSDGRPDPRWQMLFNDAYTHFGHSGTPHPWLTLLEHLRSTLLQLRQSGSNAFRDSEQASQVLALALETLPAYRLYHADLLAHQTDSALFGPFFLVRVLEAILQLRHLDDALPDVPTILVRLNDFVGHRPVAVLETRPQGEPYAHERHRPMPLYLRGAGVAHGPYQQVLTRALDILRQTDAGLLADACFNFDQLEELALDMRAYDHGHPVNRRPNYVFGEWDPHHIDARGRYSRYVVRKITIDALMDRVMNASDIDPAECLFEGAAVLAGTILMAAGVSGWGPGAHDSTTTLATLLPRIARYRDLFYEQLLKRTSSTHASRLLKERESTRQPFGSARQHLNGFLARHRATQLQQRHLAVLFAEMGYPRAGEAEAQRIVTVSVRMLSQILGLLGSAAGDGEQERLDRAAEALPTIEEKLQTGISCGAFADPWNILGFQGLFPLSSAREDAIRDTRLDELVGLVEQTFTLYARLMSECAAGGRKDLLARLDAGMEQLAGWWDPFATYEVSDLRRVHGGEAVASARSVAAALAAWRERTEKDGDRGQQALKFWRDRLEEFRTPRAFALVVEALLGREDHRAALGLLASWLGQAGMMPLEDGTHSFHNLALRWLLTLTRQESVSRKSRVELVKKLFESLEANAEDYWQVPTLFERLGMPTLEEGDADEGDGDDEDPFGAAYEGVTYRDSTAGDEGAVADGAPSDAFDLEEVHENIEARLRFLTTLARLWQIAARFLRDQPGVATEAFLLDARSNREALLGLLDSLHAHPIPEPTGDHDSLVEFDRRRVIKEQLIYATISTCLETSLAVTALHGTWNEDRGWETDMIALENAIVAGSPDLARVILARFCQRFRGEPLLVTPLSQTQQGGQPRAILRARIAQAVLRALLANLPRLGLLRETFDLLRMARSMEQAQPTQGRGVTEFNHFFQSAYQTVVENVVRSALDWPAEQSSDDRIVDLLERLTAPFLALWIEHSRTLQLSVLESVATDTAQWRALSSFVQKYGADLFHARFMTLGNLRGIMHRGVGAYLDYLSDNPDPLRPIKLIEDLDVAVPRAQAIRWLEQVLQAVTENYEEYRDYNTTTTQSDYGENLHVLLDFLRLKVQYERHSWQFRPLVLAHEVLARHGRPSTALRWEESLVQFTRDLAKQHLESLAKLERQHGVRLGTISDRLQERFIKPLALDRLCALIEPCLNEARTIEDESSRPAFVRLQEELATYTTTPTGVGLDVPAWLRRLEGEVNRMKAQRSDVARLAETFFRVPRRAVTPEEVQQQLREWERPALPR